MSHSSLSKNQSLNKFNQKSKLETEQHEIQSIKESLHNSSDSKTKRIIFEDRINLNYVMEIHEADFASNDFYSVKWDLVVQGNWKLESGIPTGVTHSAGPSDFGDKTIYFNSIARYDLSTTNLQDFPQLLLTVYGLDFFGRAIVKGYGCFHLPFHEGVSNKRVMIFRPVGSHWMTDLFGTLFGKNPEYIDPVKTLVKGIGRKYTSVKPIGQINIKFISRGKNLAKHGFLENQKTSFFH